MNALATLAFGAALLGAVSPSTAPPSSGCSSDAFAIDNSTVTVELCITSSERDGARTVVSERFTVKGQPPFVRDVTLDRLTGAESSRAIDDASLAKAGIDRSLHLTIAVRNGSVRLEHALLVPGAVALK